MVKNAYCKLRILFQESDEKLRVPPRALGARERQDDALERRAVDGGGVVLVGEHQEVGELLLVAGAEVAVAALDLVDLGAGHLGLLTTDRAGDVLDEVEPAVALDVDAEVLGELDAVDVDLGLGVLAVQEDAAVPALGQVALVGGVEVLGDVQQGLVGLGA